MSEERDWGDLEGLPEQSSLPRALCCGCGCFVPLLLFLFLAVWVPLTVSRGRDVERQWRSIAEFLPHDGRPAEWRLQFGIQAGWLSFWIDDAYYFVDGGEQSARRTLALIRTPAVERWFDLERAAVEPWTPPGAARPLERLAVQGRRLRVARASDAPGVGMFGGGEPAVVVDLTPPGSDPPLLLVLHARDEDVDPDEIVRFLEPFEIGPER